MLFIRGALIGVAIAAPVGPIGVLCIRRTLAEGRLTGLVSGLGAASADLLYGMIAVLGLTALADVLVGVSMWTRLLGGLFLCYLGLRTLREAPAERPAEAQGRGLAGAYFSTFLLTLTNPATIIAFTAIFAGLGAGSLYRGYGEGMLLVVGVAVGSALWWLTLTSATSLLRTRMTLRMLRWVNLGAGLVILGFGIAALVSLVV
ncbi:MAG: LysE family translocator [Candidatus Viridilinea halotolerans]|uniref:LysE family translocator n=1 Tax=Candidatus Viridilinea halotolerans TaxID=2491704 RepID=A0A426UC18_9CHLR|nr:MAG: LysE family translocator [Candidatus Viridilinea halotolerans]